MSKEGAQIWLEDCRQSYKGIAGSNILFDVPDETLYIDPEGKVRVMEIVLLSVSSFTHLFIAVRHFRILSRVFSVKKLSCGLHVYCKYYN